MADVENVSSDAVSWNVNVVEPNPPGSWGAAKLAWRLDALLIEITGLVGET